MAERMKIKCKLAEFDVELPFLSYAVEMYEPFNSRQVQTVIREMLREEIDIQHFVNNKVILDHFPLHNERTEVYRAWRAQGMQFCLGMVTGNF